MIRKCAEKIVFRQITRGILEENEKATYVFGYQLLMGKILSVILMLFIAGVTGTFWEMTLFMSAFIILRQYAGGFHFEKAEVCIMFSALLSVAIGIGFKHWFYSMPLHVWLGIEIISAIFIWLLAPMDTKNKRFDEIERRVYARRTKILLLMEFSIFVITIFFGIQMGSVIIAIAHLVIMVGLIASLIQKFLNIG
ncbi:MAG: accessory gene regulator B family protein [Muricomes sp.]